MEGKKEKRINIFEDMQVLSKRMSPESLLGSYRGMHSRKTRE